MKNGVIVAWTAVLAIALAGAWLVRLSPDAAPPPLQTSHDPARGAPAPAVERASADTMPDARSAPVVMNDPVGSPTPSMSAMPEPATTAPVEAGAASPPASSETEPPIDAAPVDNAEDAGDADVAGSDADTDAIESEPSGEDGNADDSAANTADAIDVERATDLMADWIAGQDAGESAAGEATTDADEHPALNSTEQNLHAFDREDADAGWSQQAQQQIQSALEAWLDALPDDVRGHLALLHVECRQTLCQVLAADSAADERASADQTWQHAIASLHASPLWSSLGLTDPISVAIDDSSGYTLYQAYLPRAAAPSG